VRRNGVRKAKGPNQPISVVLGQFFLALLGTLSLFVERLLADASAPKTGIDVTARTA
jgi:hypothetical protein